MSKDLEELNFLWSLKANHIFTQEELDEELKKHPNFWESYYLQELLARKYYE